jgi:hypothetical protein
LAAERVEMMGLRPADASGIASAKRQKLADLELRVYFIRNAVKSSIRLRLINGGIDVFTDKQRFHVTKDGVERWQEWLTAARLHLDDQ